jgi:hypothetical protein
MCNCDSLSIFRLKQQCQNICIIIYILHIQYDMFRPVIYQIQQYVTQKKANNV